MKLSIKKTIALFLCLAMIFSFAFTAFAASDEPDANIDVTETVETTTEGCENTDSVKTKQSCGGLQWTSCE